MAMTEMLLTATELGRHQSPQDCWIAVHRKVWDVTDFLGEHPGGSASMFFFVPSPEP